MNTQKIDKLLKKLKDRKNQLEKILEENGVDLCTETQGGFVFETDKTSLKKLRVAAIMDAFTLGNFEDECELFQVTSDNWKNQIEEFCPDLFFIESAWNGKDNSWYKKIAHGSKELYDLSAYCHEKGIPVVFWNKEDPVYTDVFMSAASCADYVFTTDFDCIERYKVTLQHNNVYLLHFSAQPRVHNPIEIHDRKDRFCFAGAYYHRYKDRCRVFDSFADVFEKGTGLDIFDRNLGAARPEHAFPARYSDMIIGTLKPDDIHIAYKGYNYGINMNSVGQSQTMFARRVFELLASNTVSVGNYARGVKNLFGDLTVATDSADTMDNHLKKYCSSEEDYRKYRLAGLRKVMSEHLCEDRLGFIVKCVFGKNLITPLPEVAVVACAENDDERRYIENLFNRQTYVKKTLIFINGGEIDIPDNSFVAAFSPNDYYGENYLTDLILSVRYSSCDGFGKENFFEKIGENIRLNGTEKTYRPCDSLFSTRSIVKKENISDIEKFAFGAEISGDFFCTDEFNYCRGLNSYSCKECDDLFIPDTGISLDVINKAAADIDYSAHDLDVFRLLPQDILNMCSGKIKGIDVKLEGCKFVVTSHLADNKTVYIDFDRKFLIDDFNAKEKLSIVFGASGDLNTENFCTFYDGAMNKLCSEKSFGNRVLSADIPKNAKYVRLSLRIRGSGEKVYSEIVIGETEVNTASPFLSRGKTLVVADHYPAYDDLYRYMFVHKRNLLYKESGLVPDMMCINMWNENCYREFESVNVTQGAAEKLSVALESGRISTVCVHFLNPYLWSVLKNYLDDIRLVIWSHGSDIQPWHRRMFNYKNDYDIAEAKKTSEIREALWKEVFEYSDKYDIRFVYVSEFFKKQVEEDYGVDLSGKCSIIHNCIDTELFSYTQKSAQQRFNIMSVKSFSTLTYANDITQQAVLYLSEEPEFGQMTFDFYGDGERFDEDTRLMKKFPNVHLHKGFLTQAQIAEKHKTHGIYIATTRMDTQGVSRDEAMSSGLVPVANAVAAIPEFVDETCGILVPGEDARGVADAVLKLVRDPELFLKLSKNAAVHVRGISSEDKTIEQEINLIGI